ncbi:hypothetical protein Rhe02_34070 [Rhizocola hellebori]|uniref:Uncharacterized protein n=1 Tax=Rhizocola hellebori TaxID=1392758 RepID=A0A8J3Q7N3_9ACTN|nr:hypothetical protein Rhe02_34070 [Rhizocola hellebori]
MGTGIEALPGEFVADLQDEDHRASAAVMHPGQSHWHARHGVVIDVLSNRQGGGHSAEAVGRDIGSMIVATLRNRCAERSGNDSPLSPPGVRAECSAAFLQAVGEVGPHSP